METRAQELRAAAMRERENPTRTERQSYIPPGMMEFMEALRKHNQWSQFAVRDTVAQAIADKTGQSRILAMWEGWKLRESTITRP